MLLVMRVMLGKQMPEHTEGQDRQPNLFKKGFEKSTLWMHLIAALSAFTSDVLVPLLHHCTLGLMIAALAGGGGAWLLARFKVFKHETCAAFFVFFLVTAALAVPVFAAQELSGEPEEGVAAQVLPAIRRLQDMLGIIDKRTRRIEENTNKIIGLLQEKQPNRPAAMAQHIAGMWGEGDCATVSYRFAKVDQALVVESVNRPQGTKPYKFVGTIIGATDATLEVRGEAPDAAKGLSATFRYEGNGVTRRLHWQDHVAGGTDVELNRCE